MVRKPADGLLKAAAEKWATDGATPGPAVGNVTGKPFSLNDVVYVIGSNWKQRYLVKDDTTGGYQFLDKQFNRMSGTWEKYGNKNDWDTMCATCHTTGYRLTAYDPANPKAQKAEWSELNIGCESCHGPGAAHIKSRSKKDIWNFAGKSFEEKARVCGYCHIRVENELYKSAQGNPREDLPAPKVGDSFKPSDDWRKWYPEHVVIPGVQPEDKVDADYAGDLKGLFVNGQRGEDHGRLSGRQAPPGVPGAPPVGPLQEGRGHLHRLPFAARDEEGSPEGPEEVVRELPRRFVHPGEVHAGDREDRGQPLRADPHLREGERGPQGRPDRDRNAGVQKEVTAGRPFPFSPERGPGDPGPLSCVSRRSASLCSGISQRIMRASGPGGKPARGRCHARTHPLHRRRPRRPGGGAVQPPEGRVRSDRGRRRGRRGCPRSRPPRSTS